MAKIDSEKIKNLFKNDDYDSEEISGLRVFKTSKSRIAILASLFLLICVVLFLRLCWLQVFAAEDNKKTAIESRTVIYKTNPKRGTIYDRNGNVLAFSKEARTIYANPSEIDNPKEISEKLASVLGGKAREYYDLINDKNKKFVYLKRHFDKDTAESLNEQKIKGIYLQEDQKREYPYGQVAGQIIGACNFDGDGLCGLELYYNDVLSGSSGRTEKQQGLEGMPIPGGTLQNTSVIDGQDIMISIDIELQQKVEELIGERNKRMGSKSMSAVVMEPRNGEIYAAASTPFLNPNELNKAENGATDLKCVSALHEPGSTFKTASALSVCENNILTPESEIFCPASIQADEYEVSDVHKRGSQTFTFRQILEQSSNVGIALATSKLGFDKFYNKLLQYHITEKTGIDFPGDAEGYLADQKKWSTIQSYNVSFGQGVSITPIQLVKFYTAFVNNGVTTTPHFLMRYLQAEKDEEYETQDIIENKAAIPVVVDMLRSVVTNGTGEKANIDGYGVAGKTGTGEITDNNGKYIKGQYYDSFIGFLSNASSPLLGFVGADNAPPDTVVTDTYHDIMTFAIERFKVVGK